jgi:cytoskeletal protein CcmA (bactofilin family)
MFGKKSHNGLTALIAGEVRNIPPVPTIISADMTIRGDLIGTCDLQIEGNVLGRIECDHLVIAANASVEGDVVAKAVRISGAFDGSLSAETITVVASGTLSGEIEYETLVIEAGARLEGQCRRLAKSGKDETLMSDNRDEKLLSGTTDETLLSGTTETAVESTLSHLSSVPRRVA